MKAFFKTLGFGVLYTVLLPFIVVFLALYGVYCVCMFIYIGFRSIVTFFKGGTPLGDLPEEVEAKRILMKQEVEQQAVAAAQVAAMEMMQRQAAMYAQYQNPMPMPSPFRQDAPGYQEQNVTAAQPMFRPEQNTVAPSTNNNREDDFLNFEVRDDEPTNEEGGNDNGFTY